MADNSLRAELLRRLGAPGGVMTVSQVADELGLPGPWTLRRLEKRGVLPPARRSLARSDRYYRPEDIAGLREALLERLSKENDK